jgi:hypothetical protein
MMHPDRMLAFLGKRGIVDDPGFDRPSPRQRRRHQLTYLGQHLLIRPWRIGNEMQESLMLRRNLRWRRHRRHRLHTAPSLRHQKPGAIISQRLRPIRMCDYLRQFVYVGRKAIRNRAQKLHPSLPSHRKPDNHLILKQHQMRQTDSAG